MEKSISPSEYLANHDPGPETYTTYQRLTNILTPKGGNPFETLGHQGISELVDKVCNVFSHQEISDWAQKELGGARIGLKNYGRGKVERNYKLMTWVSGFYVYPLEYKRLFLTVFSKSEMKEAKKLFFFYENWADFRQKLNRFLFGH